MRATIVLLGGEQLSPRPQVAPNHRGCLPPALASPGTIQKAKSAAAGGGVGAGTSSTESRGSQQCRKGPPHPTWNRQVPRAEVWGRRSLAMAAGLLASKQTVAGGGEGRPSVGHASPSPSCRAQAGRSGGAGGAGGASGGGGGPSRPGWLTSPFRATGLVPPPTLPPSLRPAALLRHHRQVARAVPGP